MPGTEHFDSSVVRQIGAPLPSPNESPLPAPSQSASGPGPLLTKDQFRNLLGGMSERKFDQLRADGVIGDPLELGPRCARWTQEDYADALRRLPRRTKAPEPETLAKGRRARIEAMKRPGVPA